MKPNAHVQQVLEELRAEWDRGAVEGYEAGPTPLPVWYSEKALSQLTAYERGYFFGRELRQQEGDRDG